MRNDNIESLFLETQQTSPSESKTVDVERTVTLSEGWVVSLVEAHEPPRFYRMQNGPLGIDTMRVLSAVLGCCVDFADVDLIRSLSSPERTAVAWAMVDKVHEIWATDDSKRRIDGQCAAANVAPEKGKFDLYENCRPFVARPLYFAPPVVGAEVTEAEINAALATPRADKAWATLWNSVTFSPVFSRLEFDMALSVLVGRVVQEVMRARAALSQSPSLPELPTRNAIAAAISRAMCKSDAVYLDAADEVLKLFPPRTEKGGDVTTCNHRPCCEDCNCIAECCECAEVRRAAVSQPSEDIELTAEIREAGASFAQLWNAVVTTAAISPTHPEVPTLSAKRDGALKSLVRICRRTQEKGK